MPKINPEIETFVRIKVIGIGGSGGNAVNHMINSKVKGVEFISMNTDTQDLHKSLAPKKVHLGKNLTKGLGTGMNPDGFDRLRFRGRYRHRGGAYCRLRNQRARDSHSCRCNQAILLRR